MSKWMLEEKGRGKGSYYLAKEVRGKKLKDKERSGEELFDSKDEAVKVALSKKREE